MERPYPHGQTGIDLDALRDKMMGKFGFAARYTREIDGVPVTMTIDEVLEVFRDLITSVPEHETIQRLGEMAERAFSLESGDLAGFDKSLLAGRDALAKFIADEPTG